MREGGAICTCENEFVTREKFSDTQPRWPAKHCKTTHALLVGSLEFVQICSVRGSHLSGIGGLLIVLNHRLDEGVHGFINVFKQLGISFVESVLPSFLSLVPYSIQDAAQSRQ